MLVQLKKVPLFRHALAWSGPDLLDLPFKAFVFFLLTTQLEKAQFGVVSLAMMVFSYNELMQFGVTNALMLKLPEKYVEKNIEGILADTSSSMTVAIFGHLLVLVPGLLYFYTSSIDSVLLLALFSFSLQAIVYQYYIHHILLYRYTYDFRFASQTKIVLIVSKFSIDVVLLLFYGVLGYLMAQILSYLVPIFYMQLKGRIVLKMHMDTAKIASLLTTGYPFFLMSILAIASANIDRWFVVANFTLEEFASYSVLMYLVTVLLVFPNKLLSLLSQYMREIYAINADANESFGYILNTLLAYTLLFLTVAFIMNAALTVIVGVYIPAYTDVIPLIGIALSLFLFRSYLGVLINFLYLLEYRSILISSQSISLVLSIFFYLYAIYFYGQNIAMVLFILSAMIFTQMIYIVFRLRTKIDLDGYQLFRLLILNGLGIAGLLLFSILNDSVLAQAVIFMLSITCIAMAFFLIARKNGFALIQNLAVRAHDTN